MNPDLMDTDPTGIGAQSRVARAVLAFLTADPVMSADVFLEVEVDPRGKVLALTELAMALIAGLGEAWASTSSRDDAIAYIRLLLAEQRGEDDGE